MGMPAIDHDSLPASGAPEASRENPTAGRILAAAAEAFVAGTYADVTVDQVAEAAEVTKGAVYHHFRTKEALYVAMIHRDLARKRGMLFEAIDFEGTSQDRLRALTGVFLALPTTERQLMQLIRRDANSFSGPVRGELVRAYQEALPALVEGVIRDGIGRGELVPADPRLLAWQFIANVEVLLTPYAEQRFACDDDKLNHVMSLFLNGCARMRGPQIQETQVPQKTKETEELGR
ncbi:MAG: hypothetical protein DRJ42_29645 [Deltaproteobacteria bacterium]|nr:MAG: hypothetical protein DRJ42_29645 [Deltaproteobacteria bacterium]